MNELGKDLEIIRTEVEQKAFGFLKALSDSVFKSRTTPIVIDIYGDAVDMIIARDKSIRAESAAELTRARETIEIVAVQRNAALEAVEKLREALGLYTAWPVPEVLRELSQAAEKLLGRYQYDGHGHEAIRTAQKEAQKIFEALALISADPQSCNNVEGVLEAIHKIEKEIDFCDGGNPFIFHKRMIAAQKEKAIIIEAYALSVSAKNSKMLRDTIETLRNALSRIASESNRPEKNSLDRHGMGNVAIKALAATEPATVELPKCYHCGASCGTNCDGRSHYTPDCHP